MYDLETASYLIKVVSLFFRFITKNSPLGWMMVGICGLEPQTSSLSVTRSNQLSYIPNRF